MSLAKEPHSRFRRSQPVLVDGIETYGIMATFPFLDPKNLAEDDIVTIEVTPDKVGRPWIIAEELYNSPVLDWVIILFNKPLNPVNWPPLGAIIKAPVQRVVLPNV